MGTAGSDYIAWVPSNIETIKQQCKMFIDNVVRPQVINMLRNVAITIRDSIEGNIYGIPIDTANLKDSTGVAIYDEGRCEMYLPVKQATTLQRSGFHSRNEKNIDGNLYLSLAIQDAAIEFSKGTWIVLFSAVPYAFYINDTRGFFNRALDDIRTTVISGLKPIFPSAHVPSTLSTYTV
jgi:hypothetical protein